MIFFYGSGGALVCDEPILGVTQTLDDGCARFYGGRYFVAESMNRGAAQRIAHALGGTLIDWNVPTSHQLVGATIDIGREVTRLAM